MEIRAWDVRPARPEDRDAAISLMNRAFRFDAPDPNATARWEWLFVRNTAGGRMHYLVADAGGRLAGQYALIPVRMQHDGKRCFGLLSLDTATDPEFERQGIFTELAKRLFEESSGEAPIVYGFPNSNSAPGFFKKLGWIQLNPYPMLIRPIGNLTRMVRAWRPKLGMLGAAADLVSPFLRTHRRALAYMSGGARWIREIDRFGDWADELWAKLSPGLGTCAVRDAAFLNWRYRDSPYEYRRFLLETDGVARGFSVVTVVPWRGGKLAYLMELAASPGDRAAARSLIAHAIRIADDAGASAICAMATRKHPHRGSLLAAGFLPAPASFMSQRAFGVLRNGPGTSPEKLLHVDEWFLSGADFDFI